MILSAQNFWSTYKKGEKPRFLTMQEIMLLPELLTKLNEVVFIAMQKIQQITLFPSTSQNNFHFIATKISLPTSTAFYRAPYANHLERSTYLYI